MKKISEFYISKSTKEFIYRAPACFIYEGRRWDYIVDFKNNHIKKFISNLEASKIFKIRFIKSSGVCVIRYIRHQC